MSRAAWYYLKKPARRNTRMKKEKELVTDLAARAGVIVNGAEPWDIQVHNEDFYGRVIQQLYLGLGESYMDGWWDCARLDEFFFKTIRADLEDELKNWKLAARFLKARFFNYQKKSKAVEVAQKHYDIGNDLYERMLGRTMAYTCAYWKDAKTLDEAQDAKFELVCRKIGLQPGMRVLDLGCGFGSFLKYAATHYKITGVGVNISKEQVKFARESCHGLPVDFQLIDYRDMKGKFDRVVSIGLMEHVGYKNYRLLFKVAHDCLNEDGLFLLHNIGNITSVTMADPWTNKYIFPNGHLPSIKQLAGSMEGLFMVEDLHNFGADYDKTLMAWHENFVANWPKLKGEYDERFYRMWVYYLLSCAGAFRARKIQLWQLVLSKKGAVGGYTSVR
jgi:cyclopropane-fatty-acyl-phospholipid synthase